jgi:hypothetical protein
LVTAVSTFFSTYVQHDQLQSKSNGALNKLGSHFLGSKHLAKYIQKVTNKNYKVKKPLESMLTA